MPNPDLALYAYWRSSASYRVRIGLNLKQLPHTLVPVQLVKEGGGEQHTPAYSALNPQHLVPTLVHGDLALRQSLAILEYLDEIWPEPALLPAAPAERARVRAMAHLVACDIQPLNNLRVLLYLEHELAQPQPAIHDWMQRWIHDGFSALETLLAQSLRAGDFCAGPSPSLADCCLIPQLYNARRFAIDLSAWPRLLEVEAACLALPAFAAAAPERQPDAPAAVPA